MWRLREREHRQAAQALPSEWGSQGSAGPGLSPRHTPSASPPSALYPHLPSAQPHSCPLLYNLILTCSSLLHQKLGGKFCNSRTIYKHHMWFFTSQGIQKYCRISPQLYFKCWAQLKLLLYHLTKDQNFTNYIINGSRDLSTLLVDCLIYSVFSNTEILW